MLKRMRSFLVVVMLLITATMSAQGYHSKYEW